MTRFRVCGLLLSASTVALGCHAHAQTMPAGGEAVTEVVVTAQRRSESIQSVPIAVSAFSGDDLKAQRFDSVQSLQLAVPNFNISQGGYGTSNFKIRGIGYQLVTSAGDAGGAVRSRSRMRQHRSASSSSRASLWVTCFCACAADKSGTDARGVVVVMGTPGLRRAPPSP